MSHDSPTADVRERARRIRVLLFDVDGVLTDGGIYLQADGTEGKRFDIKDGSGIVRAQRAGLVTGVLSARSSAATTHRTTQLRMHPVVQGAADKLEAFKALVKSEAWDPDTVAYMGDDVLDLGVLAGVGLATCPSDAVAAVRHRVHWVSPCAGGFGAARSLVDLVLQAQDLQDDGSPSR